MSRCYRNPYTDRPSSLAPAKQIVKKIRPACVNAINRLGSHIVDEQQSIDLHNLSIYTGTSGIIFLWHRLHQDEQLLQECQLGRLSEMTSNLLSETLHRRDNSALSKNISAFTSNFTAPCLVGALSKANATRASQCFEDYVGSAMFVNNKMPNEALYGRAGYLIGLLALRDAGYEVLEELIRKIVDRILKDGRQLSMSVTTPKASGRSAYEEELMLTSIPPPPLMFEWHDKIYLGGAHGFAGILSILLKVHEKVPGAMPPGAMESQILPTIQWLAGLQLPSGNWPSSLGKSLARDSLVQWCHGATGLIPLMLRAHHLTRDEDYLRRARRAADVVWDRGLLTKGCGLCHGSAGSGYALLSLYQHTGELQYLQMAADVAEWCTDYFKHAERTADRPLSLFEGVSGTIMYLADVLNPSTAAFPLI